MDHFERIARIVAVVVGTLVIALVSPERWWGLLGLAPLVMGLSGW